MTVTPVALTGKNFTVEFDETEVTGQVRSAEVAKTREGSQVLETFGGEVTTPGITVTTVTVELLFDGHVASSHFAALDDVIEDSENPEVQITIAGPEGDSGWNGNAKLNSLGTPIPVDNGVTARAEFVVRGPFPFVGVS